MRPAQSAGNDGAFEASASRAIRSGSGAPLQLTVAAGPAAPRAARAAIRGWMTRSPTDPLLTDALVIVGELVTNSVRHALVPAGSSIGVRAEMRGDVLFLEVRDAGTSGAVAPRRADLTHGGGFGLNLVATLARRWGVARSPGTRVWAELAVAPVA